MAPAVTCNAPASRDFQRTSAGALEERHAIGVGAVRPAPPVRSMSLAAGTRGLLSICIARR